MQSNLDFDSGIRILVSEKNLSRLRVILNFEHPLERFDRLVTSVDVNISSVSVCIIVNYCCVNLV